MVYMDMYNEVDMNQKESVVCASSAYDKKYYFNEDFTRLPDSIKDELKIMSVIFTEDVGGIFMVEFDEDGNLRLVTDADEGDLLYDDIGAALKIKQLQREKAQLFEELELFYRVFFMGEDIS